MQPLHTGNTYGNLAIHTADALAYHCVAASATTHFLQFSADSNQNAFLADTYVMLSSLQVVAHEHSSRAHAAICGLLHR